MAWEVTGLTTVLSQDTHFMLLLDMKDNHGDHIKMSFNPMSFKCSAS